MFVMMVRIIVMWPVGMINVSNVMMIIILCQINVWAHRCRFVWNLIMKIVLYNLDANDASLIIILLEIITATWEE